jgi:DNA-binding MarR family transcriptional regulator
MDLEKIILLRDMLQEFEFDLGWRLKEETVRCGITVSQCQTLIEIGRRNNVSIVELASRLSFDTSSLSRIINAMVNIGLVSRIQDPTDRRYVSVSLTESGQSLFEKIEDRYNSYYSKVFEFIPEDKREHIIDGFLEFSNAIKKCKEYHKCSCNQNGNAYKEDANG